MKSINLIAKALFEEYSKKIHCWPCYPWETADAQIKEAWIAVALQAQKEVVEA